MNNARLWILLLALLCFLSGLATGMIYGERTRESAPPEGTFGEYCELVSERFELGDRRKQLFEALLKNYEEDRQQIQDRHAASYQSAMEPELAHLGKRYRALIRDHVMPENRRSDFDRLCAEKADYTPE